MEERPQKPAEVSDDKPNVTDRDAFAEKYMCDMCHGREIAQLEVFTWEIEKWDDLDKRIKSPKFKCGGHEWRLLFFPFGNNLESDDKAVSLYLDYGDDDTGLSATWRACTQFILVMSNPDDPSVFIECHANHRFTPRQPDWGFKRFADMTKLLQTKDNKPSVIQDGKTVISVFVQVLDDPTGVLWDDFVDYDSKKATGFVTIEDLGVPCYLPSILHSLFCIRSFRRAVYQIMSEDGVATESVTLALQRLFHDLQLSDQPACATELTQSLAWKALKTITPYAPQDFVRLLLQNLDAESKRMSLPPISEHFRGRTVTRLKGVIDQSESSQTVEFSEIQLKVKGMKDLSESLKSYCAPRTIVGSIPHADGLQDAEERTAFLSLPPVLHLQLGRFFHEDELKAIHKKINDRHEYPAEIDLIEFMDESADTSQSYVYCLHAVLGHNGDTDVGSYFAYTKPSRDAQWLHFDDTRVMPVMDSRVFEHSYGGVSILRYKCTRAGQRKTNAFSLIYIRKSMIDDVLLPGSEDEVPLALRTRFKEEQLAVTEAKRHGQEASEWFVNVRVVTDKTIQQHQGFDLATFGNENGPPSELPVFRVPKTELASTFKTRISQHFGLEESKFRLWSLTARPNKTIRAHQVISDDDPKLTVQSFRSEFAAVADGLKVYLDAEEESTPLSSLDEGTVVIFTKFFDVWGQCIKGSRKYYVQGTDKLSDFVTQIKKAEGFKASPLQLYEEVSPGIVESINLDHTFAESHLGDGDIICYQVEPSKEEILDLEGQGLQSTAIQFYHFVRHRVLITFKPLKAGDHGDQFDFVVSKSLRYKDLMSKVGHRLQYDPSKLRFERASPHGTPRRLLECTDTDFVQTIINITPNSTPVIFYERINS